LKEFATSSDCGWFDNSLQKQATDPEKMTIEARAAEAQAKQGWRARPDMAEKPQFPAYIEWPQAGRISPRLRKVFAGWNRDSQPAFEIAVVSRGSKT